MHIHWIASVTMVPMHIHWIASVTVVSSLTKVVEWIRYLSRKVHFNDSRSSISAAKLNQADKLLYKRFG